MQPWAKTIAGINSCAYWTPDPWLQFFWQMLVHKGRGYTGLSDTNTAIDFIRSNLLAQTYEDCRIPFYSLATNLTQGRKTLFSSGDLAPRIMASAAMPVLYRPVEIEAECYCDGVIIELSSTEAICCRHHLDALIVHHTSVHREGEEGLQYALRQPWSLAEILHLLLYRSRPWYLSHQPLTFHRCRCGCGVPVIVMELDPPEITWPLSKAGVKVQAEAQRQTEVLLAPYVSFLTEDIKGLPPE